MAKLKTERGRFSSRKKMEAVLRVLRGEDLDLVSREVSLTAAQLSEWRDQFLVGGQARRKSRAADGRDEELARLKALEPIRQGVRRQVRAFRAGIATGLQGRHDHGRQSLSDDFQAELRFLAITSSPAFVRAPEGTGVAERFIRTLKEQLLWVQTFRTVEELRQALQAWLVTYHEQWLVERHGFRAPAQVRRDRLATEVAA